MLLRYILSAAPCAWALSSYTPPTAIQAVVERAGVFLLAFTPSCERCKEIEEELDAIIPELDFSSTDLSVNQTDIVFGKINVRDHPEMNNALGIEGTPATVLLKGPGAFEYGGSYKTKQLQQWLASKLKNSTTTLESEAEIEKFLTSHDSAFVAITGAAGFLSFDTVVSAENDFASFGFYNIDPPNTDQRKSATKGKILMRKIGETKTTELEDIDFDDMQALHRLILENQVPVISKMTVGNTMKYFVKPRPLLWIIGDQVAYNYVRSNLTDLLTDSAFSRPLYWVWFDPTDGDIAMKFVQEGLGVKFVPHQPVLLMSDLDGPGRMLMRDSAFRLIDTQSVEEFVKDCIEGRIERDLNSEPVPPESERMISKAVRKVVSRELEDWLLDEKTKDTLLFMTGPYCTQDKWCAEHGQKLFDNLSKNDKILECLQLAQLDGFKNELHPDWKLGLHPPLWLISHNDDTKTKLSDLSIMPLPNLTKTEDLVAMVINKSSCRRSKKDEL